MPRPKSGPRLNLDEDRQTWSIIDGRRVVRTGCGKGDLQGATDFLTEYLKKNHTVTPGKNPLIADVLVIYTNEHLQFLPSAESVSYDMERLTEWWGLKTISEINKANCLLYIDHRDAPTICRRELGFLNAAVMHWHRGYGPIVSMPIVVKPKKTENRHRWLTRTEAAKFLWATRRLNPRQRKRIRRFFIIGWYTGSRHKAISRVRYDMIDEEARIMHRRPPGTPETKKRTPPVRIGRRLLSHVARWRRLDGADAVYVIEHGGKPASDMGDAFNTTRDLAELSDDVIPHTLRHSRATHLMRQAVDPWEAAQSLGMSLQVLQSTYGHHHPSWQKGAAEAK